MNYVISTTGNSNFINIELMKLSVLDNEKIGYFDVITHPESGHTALCIGDLDTEILVHPNCDLTMLKQLTTAYTDEQKVIFEAWIKSFSDGILNEPEPKSGYVLGRFAIRLLLEGYVDIQDDEYMIKNGWILK